MRSADFEAIAMLTVLVVRTPMVMLWLRMEEPQLTPEQHARAWRPATRDLAAFMLGSLAMVWHCWRTRESSWRGLGFGVLAMLVCETKVMLLLMLMEQLLGVE